MRSKMKEKFGRLPQVRHLAGRGARLAPPQNQAP